MYSNSRIKKSGCLSAPRASGFTLIELIIYISIVSVVMTMIMSMAISISTLKDKALAVRELDYNARNVLTIISREVRAAERIIVPGASASSTILELDDGTTAATIFRLTGGKAEIAYPDGRSEALTGGKTDVTGLIFTNMSLSGDKAGVRIELVLENGESGSTGKFSKKYSTTVTLRR